MFGFGPGVGPLLVTPTFTIAPGHAANFCAVATKTTANYMCYLFVRSLTTGNANWSQCLNSAAFPPPLGLTQMGTVIFGGGAIPNQRGLVIGVDGFTPTGLGNSSFAGGWVITDSSGFIDVEVSSNVKATCFVSVAAPGQPVFNSRQIVAGDYA